MTIPRNHKIKQFLNFIFSNCNTISLVIEQYSDWYEHSVMKTYIKIFVWKREINNEIKLASCSFFYIFNFFLRMHLIGYLKKKPIKQLYFSFLCWKCDLFWDKQRKVCKQLAKYWRRSFLHCLSTLFSIYCFILWTFYRMITVEKMDYADFQQMQLFKSENLIRIHMYWLNHVRMSKESRNTRATMNRNPWSILERSLYFFSSTALVNIPVAYLFWTMTSSQS